MKLVRWSYHNLHMPMMADDSGTLYCTSKSLCSALNLKEDALWQLAKTYKDELDSNCMIANQAIQFFKDNKTEFGLKYVRGDMRLWSEDDMLTIAILSKSPGSKEFRKNLKELIKQNARRGYVTIAEFNGLLARTAVLEDLIMRAQPALDSTASAAGTALNAQKHTKHLRLVTS